MVVDDRERVRHGMVSSSAGEHTLSFSTRHFPDSRPIGGWVGSEAVLIRDGVAGVLALIETMTLGEIVELMQGIRDAVHQATR